MALSPPQALGNGAKAGGGGPFRETEVWGLFSKPGPEGALNVSSIGPEPIRNLTFCDPLTLKEGELAK